MVRRKISRKTPGYMKVSLWALLIAIVVSLGLFIRFYKAVFSPSADTGDRDAIYFYVHTGAEYEEVVNSLLEHGIIDNRTNFDWTAQKKNYPSHIKAGRYKIKAGMSNNELVNMLRSGKQEALMLSFNNVRTIEELAGIISEFLEPGEKEFSEYLNNRKTAEKYGFTLESFPAMFIPNTYEFYWTTSPENFAARMKREYVAFWSDSRIKKAEKMNLTPVEVATMASLVEQETIFDEENSSIAGVYINRLKKGIPLQSDPTLIFAMRDFNIRRVINEDKKLDSPYNTYKYRGLPPGPICIPSISAVDAVLNYEKHNYYYFCAKADFSGYHSFARTLSQHNKNARLYQQELNRRKIYR